MVIRADGPFLVHAHVECRNRGGAWWRFARPAISTNALLVSILTGAVDEDDEVVPLLGVPGDCSTEVRDEYTFRVAGEWALDGDERTVDRGSAEKILRSGLGGRWPTREPFERITDPSYAHATWLDRRELDRVLRMYERLSFDVAPATYCAAQAMMRELERDYEVRLILWLEHLVQHSRSAPEHRASAAHHVPR
jgi:hypothetical protein